MIHLMRFGPCPRCKGDLLVPTFSSGPTAPACSSCAYPTPDILSAAKKMTLGAHGSASNVELVIRLSANVGNYQTALIDGDLEASKAFLANVLAIGEILLARDP